MLGALLERLLFLPEVQGGVDEGHVGEGLREVAEEATRRGIVFLGEQAHIVGEAMQPLEQLTGFAAAALKAEVAREPEAAREEHAFAARQTVEPLVREVAANQPVDG